MPCQIHETEGLPESTPTTNTRSLAAAAQRVERNGSACQRHVSHTDHTYPHSGQLQQQRHTQHTIRGSLLRAPCIPAGTGPATSKQPAWLSKNPSGALCLGAAHALVPSLPVRLLAACRAVPRHQTHCRTPRAAEHLGEGAAAARTHLAHSCPVWLLCRCCLGAAPCCCRTAASHGSCWTAGPCCCRRCTPRRRAGAAWWGRHTTRCGWWVW